MERYVAPDMYMRPLGDTLDFLEAAGLEVVDVHSLREHYVWTVQPWLDTLREHRAEAVRLIGAERYRVWLLYLAGAALAFAENRMGVHQVLLVRPDDAGPHPGCPAGAARRSGRDPELDPGRALQRVDARAGRRADTMTAMNSYPWTAALANLAVTAAVVLVMFALTLAVAVWVRGGRHDGIDTVWGAGFAVIALTTLIHAVGHGDLWRQLLITALTCVWGLRLAWHITRRNLRTGEDPRYVEIIAKARGTRSRTWSAASTCRRR